MAPSDGLNPYESGVLELAPIQAPRFPPLLEGRRADPGADVFAEATAAARAGADGGVLIWAPRRDRFETALVLTPETDATTALGVIFALHLSVVDAVGALSPPEVAALWAWPDTFMINGAAAGRMRVAMDTDADTPAWMAVSIEVDIAPLKGDPGQTPDRTSLTDEGCGDIDGFALIEVWARHALLWINIFEDGGLPAIAEKWRERAFGTGRDGSAFWPEPAPGVVGVALGLDEEGGLLIKPEAGGPARRLDLAALFTRSRAAEPPRPVLAAYRKS